MWNEWMSIVWPEWCWWRKLVEGGYERDRGWARWMVWRWPWATEEWRWRLRERSERVESPGTFVTQWVPPRPFLLGSVFFRTAHSCSGGYHLDRGGMPLHDAVGINCKTGATTEYQGADIKYMFQGVMMIMCVLSDLTWLPLLGGGRKSWYIIN